MSFYTVSLLLKSTHSPPSKDEALWEERIILITAETEEQARQKGRNLGENAELEYSVGGQVGTNSDVVRWTFVQVERVCHVDSDDLSDGTELFSRFLRDSEVKSLLTPFDDK
jgi:Domain of unknown function (DUF4288)